jgi:hypothetical protein
MDEILGTYFPNTLRCLLCIGTYLMDSYLYGLRRRFLFNKPVKHHGCAELSENSTYLLGRAVAQAVSRRHPTAATRVLNRVVMWDLWWEKWHGAGFPCQSFIPPTAR